MKIQHTPHKIRNKNTIVVSSMMETISPAQRLAKTATTTSHSPLPTSITATVTKYPSHCSYE
jgi:hypothetical protein